MMLCEFGVLSPAGLMNAVVQTCFAALDSPEPLKVRRQAEHKLIGAKRRKPPQKSAWNKLNWTMSLLGGWCHSPMN